MLYLGLKSLPAPLAHVPRIRDVGAERASTINLTEGAREVVGRPYRLACPV